MSESNSKWEIGVISWSDSFESFDRYASIVTGSSSVTTASLGARAYFSTSVAADYTKSPIWCQQKLIQNGSDTNKVVYSGEVVLGPSSNSSWSGTVDGVTPSTISSNLITFVSAASNTHIRYPAGIYADGDQAIFRTVPLGWNPYMGGSIDQMTDVHYAVMPIARYDDRQSHYALSTSTSGSSFASLSAYERTYKGVRLVNNYYVSSPTATETGQYIYNLSGLNTATTRIRKYRFSYYSRLVAASIGGVSPTGGSGSNTSNPKAFVTFLPAYSGGSTIGSYSYTKEHTSISTNGEFEMSSIVLSPYGADRSGPTNWSWMAQSTNDVSGQEINYINRWKAHIGIVNGLNTAFDVDDLVVEHAHGTSDEGVGYYTIDDFPVEGSISWDTRDNFNKTVMLNGSIKTSRQSAFGKPKFSVSWDYADVSQATYYDLMALLHWQNDEGFLLCLRPYGTSLPPVLIGTMQLTRPRVNHWDASRVSFSVQFEEV